MDKKKTGEALLREAIREFIQNQYDGVITKIESKKNLKIVKVGKDNIFLFLSYLIFP